MPVYRPPRIPGAEITPREIYISRRTFIGGAAAGALLAGSNQASAAPLAASPSRFSTEEKLTPQEAVTSYNNFYEFGTGKGDPASNSQHFKPLPWSVKVD
ncbi:MAG TPA: mononuclear molybdenum enzyme YedY, partial [Pseudorhizobium sp.]|nr:mononuclear molybdenum enzyme YedY [Pseudorhizobium sp.]